MLQESGRELPSDWLESAARYPGLRDLASQIHFLDDGTAVLPTSLEHDYRLLQRELHRSHFLTGQEFLKVCRLSIEQGGTSDEQQPWPVEVLDPQHLWHEAGGSF